MWVNLLHNDAFWRMFEQVDCCVVNVPTTPQRLGERRLISLKPWRGEATGSPAVAVRGLTRANHHQFCSA